MSARERSIIAYVPEPGEYAWTFGGRAAIRTVRPDELWRLFTEDAFGGRIRSADDLGTQVAPYPDLNPQTGPFHVEGAEVGDTLAIHLVEVEPARDWAVSTTSPLFGALVGTRLTVNLQPDLPERTWIYRVDREAREVVYQAVDGDHTTRFPLEPFLGTIGVAPPPYEVRSSLVPDAHGGNMDSAHVTAGTTVYLGVNVPGALFSIGDGHYAMGDGEACGVAVEGAMETLLTVGVLKDLPCPWPRFETDEELMVAGSARPLEDAFRVAQTQLIRWVAGATSLSLLDAYQLVSQGSRSSIANVCDANYTVVTRIPKRYLPDVEWMGGIHARLRRVGATSRRGE